MTEHDDEQFDDSVLPKSAMNAPRLLAGRHKQDLRRALMNESRRRTADGGAATGAAGSSSFPLAAWLTRLGYALAVLIVVGLCGWFISREHAKRGELAASGPANAKQTSSVAGATTNPLSSGLAGLLSGLHGNAMGGGDATPAAIHDAIESGNFAFLGSITAKNAAGRVYIYVIRLDNVRGGGALYASDEFLIADPLLTVVHDRDLQEAIAREKGHFVSDGTTEIGSKIYRYRVDLADGTQEVYATDREPDVGRQRQHQQELDRLMSQKRGEIYKSIAGANGNTVYLIGVKLSDGTVKLYASAEKPEGK